MNGVITVQSQIGQGSQFLVTIPLQKRNAEDLQEQNTEQLAPVDKSAADLQAKILLVEDVLPNQIIARKFLQGFGCQVELAKDGQQSVELWENGQFDLTLVRVTSAHKTIMFSYKQIEL